MTGKIASGRVGLYFGSFNPIHLGHLVIANHMVNRAGEIQICPLAYIPREHPQKRGSS